MAKNLIVHSSKHFVLQLCILYSIIVITYPHIIDRFKKLSSYGNTPMKNSPVIIVLLANHIKHEPFQFVREGEQKESKHTTVNYVIVRR